MDALSARKGFTLIELLIVISIIVVLATLFIAIFPGAQKSARDTRRESDIKQYQTAVEAFANRSNNLYLHYNSSVQVCSGAPSFFSALGLTGACIDDPVGTAHYTYISGPGSGNGVASATSYVLYASLERTDSTGNSLYWVSCSNGSSGKVLQSSWTPSSNCPANFVP